MKKTKHMYRGKQFISIVVIFSSLLSITSCMSYQKINIKTAMSLNKKSVRSLPLLMLKTKSGKIFYCSKDYRWGKDGIEVTSTVFHKIEIDKADVVEKTVDENGSLFLVLKEGRKIKYVTLNVENDKIVLTTYKRGKKVIPYSEIELVKTKRIDAVGMLVLGAVIAVLVWGVISWLNKPWR